MDSLCKTLEFKLNQWEPTTAEQVRQFILEIMDLADQDTLDLARSRKVEQEVLDILDAPETW